MALPTTFVRPEVEEACRKIEADEDEDVLFSSSLTLAEMDRYLEAFRRNTGSIESIFFDGSDGSFWGYRFVAGILSHPQPNLSDLWLIEANITAPQLDMIDFASFESNFPSLHTVDFRDNDFGDAGVSLLSHRLLAGNKLLLDVSLSSIVGLSAVGCRAIASALNLSRVKALDLRSNPGIGDEGVEAIAGGLYGNTTLDSLELGSVNLGSAGCSALALAIPFCCLDYLDLNDNNIGDRGAIAIATACASQGRIQRLCVCGNSITHVGAKAIASVLKQSKMEYLAMNRNQIGDGGAKALAEAIRGNGDLARLEISNNGIGVQGGLAIAKALRQNKNSSIYSLNLSYNLISEVVAEELILTLHVTSHGRHPFFDDRGFYLEGTGVSQHAIERIRYLASKNSRLFRLFEDKLLKDKKINPEVVPRALEVFKDDLGLLFMALKSTLPVWNPNPIDDDDDDSQEPDEGGGGGGGGQEGVGQELHEEGGDEDGGDVGYDGQELHEEGGGEESDVGDDGQELHEERGGGEELYV